MSTDEQYYAKYGQPQVWEDVSEDNEDTLQCWRYNVDNYWGDVLFVTQFQDNHWGAEISSGQYGLHEIPLDVTDLDAAKIKAIEVYTNFHQERK